MRVRVSSAAPGTNEAILDIDGFKFRVDLPATAALYAEPRHVPVHEQCQLDQVKRIFPPAIAEQLGTLGLHLEHLAKDFGWPACAWFPSSFRTYQNHLFAFHLVGAPTDATHERLGGDLRSEFENPTGNRPIELRIGRSPHPERQHLLTLWVSVPGVPLA